MKRNYIGISLVLTGSAIGYLIGTKSGLSGWGLFREMFFGMLVGLFLGIAFIDKQYGILIGAIVGLVVEGSLDFLAGSPIVAKGKLASIYICSFIGWGFPVYLKQMIIGGLIGGIIGFGWGLSESHWFGEVCLTPGVFTASLMFVVMSIAGMSAGKLFMMFFGYRFSDRHSQN